MNEMNADVMKNGADSTGKHGNSNSNIISSLLGTHSEAVLWDGQGATPPPVRALPSPYKMGCKVARLHK